MNNYDKLMASSPVNKQAALVTSCVQEEDTELKALVAQAQYLEDAIKTAKKHRHMSLEDVQRMGREKHTIQMRINELKGNIKKKLTSTIEFHFMEVCRTEMPPLQFRQLIRKAMDRRGDNAEEK